jgi:hypothetical protein
MTPDEVQKTIEALEAGYSDTAKINVDMGKVVLDQENKRLEAENKELKQIGMNMKSWLIKKELYKDFIKDVYGVELPKSLSFDSEE